MSLPSLACCFKTQFKCVFLEYLLADQARIKLKPVSVVGVSKIPAKVNKTLSRLGKITVLFKTDFSKLILLKYCEVIFIQFKPSCMS